MHFFKLLIPLGFPICINAAYLRLEVGDLAKKDLSSKEKADAVKQAFQTAWDGYYKYAFPHDSLKPVTNSFNNGFGQWGASTIDALSTALVMGKTDVVNIILDHISTIDFTTSPEQISLFETTIRYLGGLLSGYDLLKGPLSNLASNGSQVDMILTKAKSLADSLKFAFNTDTGIPHNGLNLTSQTTDGGPVNGIATIGTLVLEWTRLSDLTGDGEYAQLTQKAESYLLAPEPQTSEPFPGLIGTNVFVSNGTFADANGGWGGGDDSFYEYLIKMYVYDYEKFSSYKDRWVLAVDSSIEYLASKPSSRQDLTFFAAYRGTDLVYTSNHLACFNGGNLILGGSVLGEQKYVDFGLELVDSCEGTYNQTLTGIGPESFSWAVVNTTNVPSDQVDFYEKAGFWIDNGVYVLRPEVLESFYMAYRVTGDQKYRDWSWNAFLAITSACRTGSGYAELQNVNAVGGGGYTDNQDSFFFAEVLKYAYLIHADDQEYQVQGDGKNQWVFNTEAHPVKVSNPIT